MLKQLHLLLHTVQAQALLYSETSPPILATLPPVEEEGNKRKYPEHPTEEAKNYRNRSADSGWTTTAAAARALGVTSRTIGHYIDRGDLDGKLEEGTDKRIWLVSIDSLNTLRAKRGTGGFVPETAPEIAEAIPEAMRDLAVRLENRASEAAELRTRLSSLRDPIKC